jgi:hypothetical protein
MQLLLKRLHCRKWKPVHVRDTTLENLRLLVWFIDVSFFCSTMIARCILLVNNLTRRHVFLIPILILFLIILKSLDFTSITYCPIAVLIRVTNSCIPSPRTRANSLFHSSMYHMYYKCLTINTTIYNSITGISTFCYFFLQDVRVSFSKISAKTT